MLGNKSSFHNLKEVCNHPKFFLQKWILKINFKNVPVNHSQENPVATCNHLFCNDGYWCIFQDQSSGFFRNFIKYHFRYWNRSAAFRLVYCSSGRITKPREKSVYVDNCFPVFWQCSLHSLSVLPGSNYHQKRKK